MLKIVDYNTQQNYRTLENNDRLFHRALEGVIKGENRFHVKNSRGEDFDLEYMTNNDLIPKMAMTQVSEDIVLPPFLQYDEYNDELVDMTIFDGYDQIFFEALNEYTIVLTKLILSKTNLNVWFHDQRILWFVDPTERLHIAEDFPEGDNKTYYCPATITVGYTNGTKNKNSATVIFTNVFLLQYVINRPLSQFKYVEITVPTHVGIGGVLSNYLRISAAFQSLGIKPFLKKGSTRFGDEVLSRYFNIQMMPEDATEENTVYVVNIAPFVVSDFVNRFQVKLTTDMLNPRFIQEIEEYKEAVIGDKKMLGILVRGTDYIATEMKGTRQQATVDEMLPVIRDWMEKDQYDGIFLATEDQDVLDRMKMEFGEKLRAIAQERYTIRDFKKGQTIAAMEKEKNSGQEYQDKLEDMTANYFYALYILANCESFMASGLCNGLATVNSFNGGKFKRNYMFQIGVEGNPITKNWKQLSPVFAGVFARAVYPEEKAFFMTFHLKMDEIVDAQAVKSAWNTTLEVYPYFKGAILKRYGKYVLTENPLDFVIKETNEIIEPSTPAGNFHLITICYSGHDLVFYIDHVATDMTAMARVFETFLYYYYCEADKIEYPIPAGVHTTASKVSFEEAVLDAYTMVNPIDPAAMANQAPKTSPTYELPEFKNKKAPESVSDYGRFMITVKSSDLMNYAKSVHGSPMSVLAQLTIQAIQRVHPENTTPICLMVPVSVRKMFHCENSMLHQVVQANYTYQKELLAKDASAEELNTMFRGYLSGFTSERSLKMVTAVYAGMIENFKKAAEVDMLSFVLEKLKESQGNSVNIATSYFGTIKTGDYGNRTHLEIFHVMPDNGLMIQMTEIGDTFYISWCQGNLDDVYVKAAVENMHDLGMMTASYTAVIDKK